MLRARLAKLVLLGSLGFCSGCLSTCSESTCNEPLLPRLRGLFHGGRGECAPEDCCDVTGYPEGGPVLSDLGGSCGVPPGIGGVPGEIPGTPPYGVPGGIPGYPQVVPPGTAMPPLAAPPGARVQPAPPGGTAPIEPYRPTGKI